MKLDFWFLVVIILILVIAILTAWMLSEHFRLEKEKMERQAVQQILNEQAMSGHHRMVVTKAESKVLAKATVLVLPKNDTKQVGQ